MDEIRARELDPACERGPDAELLDERGRDGEADEREPDETGKHEDRRQERERDEDEHADRIRDERGAAPERALEDDRARADVAQRHENTAPGRQQELAGAARHRHHERVHRRDGQTDREPHPEAVPVRPHRLAHELPDRALLRWERGRKLARACPGHEAER